MCLLQDEKVDIACVTETWLTDQANHVTSAIKSYGYDIIHTYRGDNRGGGTAVIYHSSLKVATVNLGGHSFQTFEHVVGTLRCDADMNITIVSLYRTGLITSRFFEEFDEFLAALSLKSDYLVLTGDFNIHMETGDSYSAQLLQITDSYGLKQLVKVPTHQCGGTLDLVFDNSNLILESSLKALNCNWSDHLPVTFSTQQLEPNRKVDKTIWTRSLKAIDLDALSFDLIDFISDFTLSETFEASCMKFFSGSKNILDMHAPLKEKTISFMEHAPWFDSEYKDLRKLRRKAEKKRNEDDRNQILYEEIRAETSIMANLKKQQYYSSLLDKNKHDTNLIFNIVNKELDRKQQSPLPATDDIPKLCSKFNEYFKNKILKIREKFPVSDLSTYENYLSDSTVKEDTSYLSTFVPCTVEELKDIIKNSGIKCSPSDFLPTDLLKDNISNMLPVLCQLVNQSLETGCFDGLKTADIIPTLKDQKLDPDDFKSYRPISNLSFLGKLVERVVLNRLNDHMTKHKLNIPEQSAYKKHHSTETILIKITNDLMMACDKKSATVLMLLDLSAAFDTVEHRKLLKILRDEIKISGTALKWFQSFLTGRYQRTRIGSDVSESIVLEFGVPQGSVLGPVLFNIYIRSLYLTVKKAGFNIHGYADDQQVYKSFKPCEVVDILNIQIINCFKIIETWMVDFCLHLNPGKTQILLVAPKNILKEINVQGVLFHDNTCIRFISSTKDLGILMDQRLTFEPQILNLKRDCFRLLRNVVKRRYLFSNEQLKLIVNSIIVCKLDYCNSLYYGVNKHLLNQLQLIQNAAAKAIVGLYKFDHLGDTLKDLHWLPIIYRIVFKILLIVFKCLNGMGPDYLCSMLNFAHFNHSIYLVEPRTFSSFGDRSFQKIAPKLWNDLPCHIKKASSLETFKSSLKTYLFHKAFNIT